jgi:hypothetical protein
LQLIAIKPALQKEDHKGASLWTLAKDPYILLVSGAITITNMAISFLEAGLPVWIIQTMDNPPAWQLGVALLPTRFDIIRFFSGSIHHKTRYRIQKVCHIWSAPMCLAE